MSEPRRLSDAELLAQLRRRSSDQPALSEQWRSEFVGGVEDKIDSGAPTVSNRRLPAFAGLAAGVAIVLVLVVAMPAIIPGGGSPSPNVPSISAMSAPDFAARLATGDLDGDTVLVTGSIRPYDGALLYGATCSIEREQDARPDFTCSLGRLDGIDPPVWVDAPYVATPPGEESFFPDAPYVWAAPQPPIEGVLALSVDEFRRVTLIGRDPAQRLTSSLPEILSLALDSVSLDEIRVVPAWLTGIVAPISCGPPDPGTYLADLPGRGCAGPSWLAPDPAAVDPDGYTIPEDWLQVQSNAYLDFAPDLQGAKGSAEPRHGHYVVAKRLEGSGCPGDQPPCWQWKVLGRVSVNGDGTHVEPAGTAGPMAIPTPSVPTGVRFECAGPPLPPGETPVPGPLPIVIDETGLIEACSQTDFITELTGEISVSNPFEAKAIEVVWVEGACDSGIEFTFRATEDGYELAGERPTTCSDSRGSLPLYIGFLRPMPADSVAASISDVGVTGTPAPTPSPTIPPLVESRHIDCEGAPVGMVNGAVWMEDHTGLVRECVVRAIQPPDETSARFETDPPSVTLSWMVPCVTDRDLTQLELWARAARAPVELSSAFETPYLLVANRLPQTDPFEGCFTAISGREVTIYFNEEISADDLEWFFTNGGRGSGTSVSPGELFALSLESDKREYAADELIELEIGLWYEGPETTLAFDDHLGPRLHIEQLDGDLEMTSTAVDYDCRADGPLTLPRWETLALSHYKTIGYSEDDPNADIYSAYWNDAQLRLPAGRYRLLIDTTLYPDGLCGDTTPTAGLSLEASIVIEVH